MSFLWWRIRYAYWMQRRTGCTLSFAWQSSNASDINQWSPDSVDYETPRDAVDIELSYWEA